MKVIKIKNKEPELAKSTMALRFESWLHLERDRFMINISLKDAIGSTEPKHQFTSKSNIQNASFIAQYFH